MKLSGDERLSLSLSQGANAATAIKLLSQGEINQALHYLNLCLDNGNEKVLTESDLDDQGASAAADEVSLLEKRCLIHMKLHHFDEVLSDARRILDKRTDHSLTYKCLLVCLCKTNNLEPVNEILKLWRNANPQDLDMIECRTKLMALIDAVKTGIEPAAAFSKLEDQLGLSYDWLLARKPSDPRWRHRPLPHGITTNTSLCLPFRFGHCPIGAKCPDAHGAEELEEWKSRSALKNVSMFLDTIKLDSGGKYINRIMDRLNNAPDPSLVISETLPDGMRIILSKPLEVKVQASKSKVFKWTFAIETQKPLTCICLLYDLHREYFYISSAVIYGANTKVNLIKDCTTSDTELQVVEVSSPTALIISGKKPCGFTYKVEIKFKPDVYGNFRQTVVFDIGDEIKYVRRLVADVVPAQEFEKNATHEVDERCSTPTLEDGSSYRVGGTWNIENAEILDGHKGEKVPSSKLGFDLINGANGKGEGGLIFTDPMTKDNYKERMRYFLTQEEKARQQILTKYNLTAPITLASNYVMTGGLNDGLTRYAVSGQLYGRMTLFRDVSEDTAVGRLILRSCNYLLLTKTEVVKATLGNAKTRVFLCPIADKTKNNIYIDIGPACVTELGFTAKEVAMCDVQFQLDRTAFMEMKSVIEKLEKFHIEMLFPDFNLNYHIPWIPIKQWGNETDLNVKLNPRQKEAVIAVTSESEKVPPILIIGPFGTGKTFTLALCIRKLLLQPNVRIMICTHSNSAADLYIKEYLDPWVQDGLTSAKPLRIYYHMRNLNSVHPDVLQYCIVEQLRFRPPTVEEILAHKVIVVTLSTSYMLMNLDLPKDTFSHILLDEAAQAMESEAITPLMCAGEFTKLVLAGDHLQLSPELFSEEARSLHPSLLERLHNYYPESHPCKLMLCENYRSHSALIDYVSEAFYSKQLHCSMAQPVHDTLYPLTFFSARGEEVQESDSTSYFNMGEVFEIVDQVQKLVSSWPPSWGNYRQEGAIGVLTPYSDQVARIRSALRKKRLYSVSVERVLNVQGKQFRAVFLSTVRSFRPWVKALPESIGNEVDLGFFSNPKLLNTALTRAQSLVAVVGDPVCLCSEGKCRNLWKDFISICHRNKSLYGMSYTQLEQNILGLEMRLTWGLNPLADIFQPKTVPLLKPAPESQLPVVTASHHSNQVNQPPPAKTPTTNKPPQTTVPPNPPSLGPHSGHHQQQQQQQQRPQFRLQQPQVNQINQMPPQNIGSPIRYPHNQIPSGGLMHGISIPVVPLQQHPLSGHAGPPSAPGIASYHDPRVYEHYEHSGGPVTVPFPASSPRYRGPPPNFPPSSVYQVPLVPPSPVLFPVPPVVIPTPLNIQMVRYPYRPAEHGSNMISQSQSQQQMRPQVSTYNRQNIPMNYPNPNAMNIQSLYTQQQPTTTTLARNTSPRLPNQTIGGGYQNLMQNYNNPPPQQQQQQQPQHPQLFSRPFTSTASSIDTTFGSGAQIAQASNFPPRRQQQVPNPPTFNDDTINISKDDIAELPFADLMNFHEMLEQYAATDGSHAQTQELLLKFREAVSHARRIPPQLQSLMDMDDNINARNNSRQMQISCSNEATQTMPQSMPQNYPNNIEPRTTSLTQQLNDCKLFDSVDSIWTSLGLQDDDEIPPQTTTTSSSSISKLHTIPQLNLSQSHQSVSQQRSKSRMMEPVPPIELQWNTNELLGVAPVPDFGPITGNFTSPSTVLPNQASSPPRSPVNPMSPMNSQESLETPTTRSYANVAKRAVPVSAEPSSSFPPSYDPFSSSSSVGMLHDHGQMAVPPYPFLFDQQQTMMSNNDSIFSSQQHQQAEKKTAKERTEKTRSSKRNKKH